MPKFLLILCLCGTLQSSRIHAPNGHSWEGMKLCFCYAAAVWSFVTIVSSCMTMLRAAWHLAWHCSSSVLTWETLWTPRIAPRWVVHGKTVKKDVIVIKWVTGSRQEMEASWKNTCPACRKPSVRSLLPHRKQSVAVRTCIPSTREVEVKGEVVQGHPWLLTELEARLGHRRSCPKEKTPKFISRHLGTIGLWTWLHHYRHIEQLGWGITTGVTRLTHSGSGTYLVAPWVAPGLLFLWHEQ